MPKKPTDATAEDQMKDSVPAGDIATGTTPNRGAFPPEQKNAGYFRRRRAEYLEKQSRAMARK